ncbi:MAG: hypothetical protein QOD74_1225 [Variibacter sp.]|nr:hypothetical protein [Variibacter sp.]
MARGFPSMTALLGLLAVAGYQNRDKIAEMLRGAGAGNPNAPGGATPGLGGLLGSLGGGALGGGGAGGFLNNGLRELVDRFKETGHGEEAESWVGPGANKSVSDQQLRKAIGPETLSHLKQQTGLSEDELLARLSRELPNAVDRYTPDGRLPDRD